MECRDAMGQRLRGITALEVTAEEKCCEKIAGPARGCVDEGAFREPGTFRRHGKRADALVYATFTHDTGHDNKSWPPRNERPCGRLRGFDPIDLASREPAELERVRHQNVGNGKCRSGKKFGDAGADIESFLLVAHNRVAKIKCARIAALHAADGVEDHRTERCIAEIAAQHRIASFENADG